MGVWRGNAICYDPFQNNVYDFESFRDKEDYQKFVREEQLYISSCVQNSEVITYESSSTKKKG